MKVVSSMIMLCLCVGSAQAAGLLAKDFLQARPLEGRPLAINPKKFGKKESPVQAVGKDELAPIPPKQFPGSALPQRNLAEEVGGLQEGNQKAPGRVQGSKGRPTSCSHPSCMGEGKPTGIGGVYSLVEQPSATDMARFEAEGPQQMAAAKAAGNCKMLVSPLNIFRCQVELDKAMATRRLLQGKTRTLNEAQGVIGKAMAANQCGSLSKVEDVTACLQLQEGAALAKHATALVEQPTPAEVFQARCGTRFQGGCLSKVGDITNCLQLIRAKAIVVAAGHPSWLRHGAMLLGCSRYLGCTGHLDLAWDFARG